MMHKIRKSRRIVVVIVLVCVLMVGFVLHMSYNQYVNPKSTTITDVMVTDEAITVEGFNYGGMFNYLGYKLRYDSGELHVAFRGGWWMPWMPETNCPEFYPIPNVYPDLKAIYFCDRTCKNQQLIWQSPS